MRDTLRGHNMNLYWCWKGIKQRCQNPKSVHYHNYGDRGIKVCDEWQTFEPFYEWAISNGWKQGLTIDRIDTNGNYCPENCRWVTARENVNNRRKTLYIDVDGVVLPRTVWEEKANLSPGVAKNWVATRGKEYAAERIKEALDGDYKPHDYGRNHKRTAVRCIETGEIFQSFWEADKKNGGGRGNILSAAKRNGGRCGKYHYELV